MDIFYRVLVGEPIILISHVPEKGEMMCKSLFEKKSRQKKIKAIPL